MAHTNPTIELVETEKVLLSAAPALPDGTPDPNVVLSWTSSNPSQVGVDIPANVPDTEPPIPNTNNHVAWATTPLANGSAVISIKAQGGAQVYEEVLQPVTYTAAVPGSLNVSGGVPVSDS